MKRFKKILHFNAAQSTVEAAVIIPILFVVILLLIQPGIILYDLIIMNSAAAETCRVLSTCSDADKQKVCDAFIRRRLSAIPQQENFHLHQFGCSYDFDFCGNENMQNVSVTITNQVRPLPIIGFISSTFGLLNKNNCFEIKAYSQQYLKPSWTENTPQGNMSEKWVGKWLEK